MQGTRCNRAPAGVDLHADGTLEKNNLQTRGDIISNTNGTDGSESLRSSPPNKWQKIFRAMRNAANAASYSSGIAGMTQIGMIEYRQALPLENKISTFGKFSSIYKGVGTVRRVGGNIGYFAAALNMHMDYSEMTSNNITTTKFAYRTTSTFASIFTTAYVGAKVGGPWGAAAGTLVGGATMGLEIFHDWWDNNITPQINRSFQFDIQGLMQGFKP